MKLKFSGDWAGLEKHMKMGRKAESIRKLTRLSESLLRASLSLLDAHKQPFFDFAFRGDTSK